MVVSYDSYVPLSSGVFVYGATAAGHWGLGVCQNVMNKMITLHVK